jgi:hypothetical protein
MNFASISMFNIMAVLGRTVAGAPLFYLEHILKRTHRQERKHRDNKKRKQEIKC